MFGIRKNSSKCSSKHVAVFWGSAALCGTALIKTINGSMSMVGVEQNKKVQKERSAVCCASFLLA